VVPNQNLIITISRLSGGTIRWTSPELFDPAQFGLKEARPTEKSDCYALGMVIYEVLSGQVPFAHCVDTVVILDVMRGERPRRPQGAQGAWFTGGLWGMLELCWESQPGDRPSLRTVLQCLEGVRRPSMSPPTPAMNRDVEKGTDDLLDFIATNPGMSPGSPGSLWLTFSHSHDMTGPTSVLSGDQLPVLKNTIWGRKG